jgi:hypothetical protein
MARRAQRRSRCCEQIPEKFGDVGEDAVDAQAHKLGKVVAGPLGVDVPVEDVSRSPYGLAQLVHALDQAGCLSAGALVTIGKIHGGQSRMMSAPDRANSSAASWSGGANSSPARGYPSDL